MAHQIESMAFAGSTPWHGLGTPLTEDDLYNWQSACQKAGLDWTAETVPLELTDTKGPLKNYLPVSSLPDRFTLGRIV